MQYDAQSHKERTREQIEVGLDQLKSWYPEEAERIDHYREDVLAHLVDGVELPADHPIWSEEHAVQPQFDEVELSLSPCLTQVAEVAVEAGTFIVSVAGFVTAARFRTMFERGIVASLGVHTAEYERAITPLLKAFNEANGALAKAQAFAPIAQSLWNLGAIQVIFDVIKNQSTWAEWILDGAIALGQIVIWVVSEFFAAVVEFIVVILSATHLLLSIRDAFQVCFPHTS